MPQTLAPLRSIPLGRYRHYKGGEYEVLGVARHSETLEAFVMYRPLYNASGVWVRPLSMFLEQAEFNGEWQPRFRYLSTPSAMAERPERALAST
ncbi:DUF1653 domain-containing protein [Xylophilus sp. GOD-11R]|uniref:DUF1653 domain-containing protein n=1 Tax=Xylophilus sp. GOD-11R TaxID=3089814 RepID=UPI00298CFCBE|nr:DUF1653 domain-containing protein [Xylophilus sp. GOD-11R]WPB55162.1 DUF1653 domain-containing protein [Xylophilus sp. GOD-11R]